MILEKYIIFEENNYWKCRLCQHKSNGHPNRMIAHLTCVPGMGIKVCQNISPEKMEELRRELGLRPHSTDVDRQPMQQLAEKDDAGQVKRNKKRKCMLCSGTTRSNSIEAEMPPPGACNSSALCESISVSEGNTWSLQNLEEIVGARGLQQLDNSEQNSPFFVSDFISSPMPAPFQVNIIDHTNDQCTHRLQDGVGADASDPGNAFGVGMAREPSLGKEPQPPCPPGFNPNLWKFYLEIDRRCYSPFLRNFDMYERCISQMDEEDTKGLLACLESACFEVRNRITNAPNDNRKVVYDELLYIFTRKKCRYLFGRRVENFTTQVGRVEEIEKEIKGETEQGVQMLGKKRNNEMKRWLGYAANFKSDADDLDVDALEDKSPEEMLQLLNCIEQLIKVADILIETGTSLLKPNLPKDLLSWNPTSMSCGSRLLNRMPPRLLTQPV